MIHLAYTYKHKQNQFNICGGRTEPKVAEVRTLTLKMGCGPL